MIQALLAGMLYVSSAAASDAPARHLAPSPLSSLSRINTRGSHDLEARANRIARQIIARCRRQGLDAEDCLQDVCVDLLSSGVHTGPDAAHLDAWVAALGRHKTIDSIRARSRRPANELTNVISTNLPARDEDPAISIEHKDSHRALRAAMKKLKREASPRSYRVLHLRYFKGLSTAEIAGELNLTPAQVWAREHRMKAKLREYLE
jgi:RNA polymerase sigma factor (sigma-70 family)